MDVYEKRINIFKRLSGGEWKKTGSFKPIHGVDNIEFDSEDGSLMMGSIPSYITALKKNDDPDVIVPGGMMRYRENPKSGKWEFLGEVNHDGLKLSQISIGVQYGNQVILGSPYSNGVVVCVAPKV